MKSEKFASALVRRMVMLCGMLFMATANSSLFTLRSSLIHAQTPQEWRDSVETLSEQIRKDPKNIDLRLKKAEGNISLQQWDYAAEEYGQVLKLDPDNLAALYFRAYTYDQKRQWALARADYESFLGRQPRHFAARLGLAHVLQKLGRKNDTLDQLNTLVEQFPDSAEAYAARAAFETEQEHYDLAHFDWHEAVKLAPKNTGFVVSEVDVLLRMNRRGEALAALDEAVRRGTKRAELQEWYRIARNEYQKHNGINLRKKK